MALQFRKLTALEDEMNSVPNTHIKQLTAACNPSSRGLVPSSELYRRRTHKHIATHIYAKFKIKIKSFLKYDKSYKRQASLTVHRGLTENAYPHSPPNTL